jgi:hypothetical protein
LQRKSEAVLESTPLVKCFWMVFCNRGQLKLMVIVGW